MRTSAGAVGQELLGDCCGPLGGLADGIEVLPHHGREVGTPEDEFGGAEDDEHLVVRFVRDAARQLTGHPEPLGLAVTVRGELLVGHVALDRRGPTMLPAGPSAARR